MLGRKLRSEGISEGHSRDEIPNRRIIGFSLDEDLKLPGMHEVESVAVDVRDVCNIPQDLRELIYEVIWLPLSTPFESTPQQQQATVESLPPVQPEVEDDSVVIPLRTVKSTPAAVHVSPSPPARRGGVGASGGHDGDEDTFEDALEDEFSVPRDEVLRLYSVRDAPVDPLFTPTVVRTTAVVPKELPVTVKDADLALPVVDVREVKRVHAPPPSSTTPTQVPSREVRGSTDKVAEQDPRQEVDSQAFASVVDGELGRPVGNLNGVTWPWKERASQSEDDPQDQYQPSLLAQENQHALKNIPILFTNGIPAGANPMNIRTITLLIVGNSGVGKTMFCQRFCGLDRNQWKTAPTIGPSPYMLFASMPDGEVLKVVLVDTQGSDNTMTTIGSYFSGVHGVFFMFDITQRRTFDNLKQWRRNAEKSCKARNPEGWPVLFNYVFGNKIDLPPSTFQVSKEDVAKLEERQDAVCVSFSALYTDTKDLQALVGQVISDIRHKLNTGECPDLNERHAGGLLLDAGEESSRGEFSKEGACC